MGAITSARAYANNEVVFVAWTIEAPILGCLGFEITRIYVTDGGDGTPAGTQRVLAAWVPFEGQGNPSWEPQTTSLWPVQKMTWRDLTVRQRRDQIALRASGVTLKYLVRPLIAADGVHEAVAGTDQPNAAYTGEPRPLAYLDAGYETPEVVVGTTYGGKVKVAFNNGILSTQWLKHAFEQAMGQPLTRQNLMDELKQPGNQYREYLDGDLLPVVTQFVQDAVAAGDDIYAALYELGDDELEQLLLANAPNVHLILSNSSKDDKTGAWDSGNAQARQALMAAQPALAELHHRMFNNSAHIGHNKFLVRVNQNGAATHVLTGSTNWTTNGLCAQTNNMLVVESDDLAKQYFAYWQDLRDDTQGFVLPDPMSAATSNVQGSDLRRKDALVPAPVRVNGADITAWRSPNTRQVTKGKAPPPDLGDLFSRMRQAKKAIFFAVFLPSQKGAASIIDQAIQIGLADPSLMIYGCVSSPMAMPNYVPASERDNEDNGDGGHAPQPAMFEQGNVHIVRASALTQGDVVGDFEAELLTAGNAIIHDNRNLA